MSGWWFQIFFNFDPENLGKWSNLTSIFFRWVETPNYIVSVKKDCYLDFKPPISFHYIPFLPWFLVLPQHHSPSPQKWVRTRPLRSLWIWGLAWRIDRMRSPRSISKFKKFPTLRFFWVNTKITGENEAILQLNSLKSIEKTGNYKRLHPRFPVSRLAGGGRLLRRSPRPWGKASMKRKSNGLLAKRQMGVEPKNRGFLPKIDGSGKLSMGKWSNLTHVFPSLNGVFPKIGGLYPQNGWLKISWKSRLLKYGWFGGGFYTPYFWKATHLLKFFIPDVCVEDGGPKKKHSFKGGSQKWT